MNQVDPTTQGLIHDMRNLMSVINANCSLLLTSNLSGNSAVAEEIVEAVVRLDNMLLTLGGQKSDLKSGGTKEARPTVQEVAAEAIGFLEPLFPAVDFELTCDPRGFDLAIPQQDLFRMLMNLLSNAAEAAEANAKRDPRVSIQLRKGDGQILVSDTGNGFEDYDASKWFEPFVTHREDRTTNKQAARVHEGLGLHVVQSIVQMHGGKVTIAKIGSDNVVSLSFASAKSAAYVSAMGSEAAQPAAGNSLSAY